MTSKLITIIIATFNAGKTLNQCLKSIICQKSNDIELIIIDGGSTDNTKDIIQSHHEYIDYFVSEPDNGVYDAWNKGIMVSTGKWIMFIGSDDKLLSNSLNDYRNYILKTDNPCSYDYICAQNNYVRLDGSFIKRIGKEPSWNNMRYYMAASHVASLHNRKLFDEVGFYDIEYSICGDYELLLRKRDKLKYIYLHGHVFADMCEGGISMSSRAVFQTYIIRKKHHTINEIINLAILIKSLLLYKFYNLTRGN